MGPSPAPGLLREQVRSAALGVHVSMRSRRSLFFSTLAGALALQVSVTALGPTAGAGAASGRSASGGSTSLLPGKDAAAVSHLAASPDTGPTWTLESTPVVGSGSQLNGIRCATATDCLGVGFEDASGTRRALAEEWNGTSWAQQSMPLPSGSTASELNAISCGSATSCTAVGYYQNTSVIGLTLAESWNGSSWSVVNTPSVTGAKLTEFTGVSCVSTSSCLAVGYYQKSGTSMTFAEIWNGKTWTGQTTPNPSTAKLAQLQGVSCASSSACTAAGNYTNASNVEVTLAESWNGKAWSLLSTPALSGARASAFGSVSCPSATDCTAAGDEVNSAGTELTLAEAWNGKTWTEESTPGVSGSVAAVFTGISCPVAGSCTAVGWYTTRAKVTLTLAEGWNGKTWYAQTTASSSGAPENYLAGVACAAAAFCSAVGNQTTTKKAHLSLAEQWVGSRVSSTTSVSASSDPVVTGQTLTITATVAPSSSGAGEVSGTVTFTSSDGTVTCSGGSDVVNVSNDKAACLISGGFATSANRTVTAKYSGSGLVVSSSATLTETVGRDQTTTVVESSANPSLPGQAVTFTADAEAASPGSGTPTGSMTFTVSGTSVICNDGTSNVVALSAGKASCAVVGPAAATAAYTVEALYSGDGNYISSNASLSQDVHQGGSSVDLVASSNPSVNGQSVTYTATVSATAPATGTPTWTVTFSVTSGVSCRAGNTVALSGGTATCVVPGLAPADSPYTVGVTYSGDTNFATSTTTLDQTVDKGSSTTSLVSSANPSSTGQGVTFTATVSPVAPAVGTPSGSVTFSVSGGAGTVSCTGGDTATLSGGVATCTVPGLAPTAAPYTVSADYSGDAGFATSTKNLTQDVGTGNTSVVLASSANPGVSGQTLTFTATVSAVAPAVGTPTGTVTFAVTGSGGAVTCNGGNGATLSAGKATCSITGFAAQSTYSVHATYGGDSGFSGASASPLTQTVNLGATTTAISSNANPSVSGETVTFTATVSANAPATGTPTGTVTFSVTGAGGAVTCNGGNTGTLSGGKATCSITGQAAQSTYTVRATYNADTNYSGSAATPLTQTVGLGSTTTGLTSNVNPAVSGQTVTFTATVAPVAPATGTPTGTATFAVTGSTGAVTCNGGNTVTLSGGTATCSITGLASQSTYTVRATYNGDSNYSGTLATPLTETVDLGATTTAISSNANPSVSGETVTFTATVSASTPATGTPTGSVTFAVTGSAGAVACSKGNTVTLSGGTATCAITGVASQSTYSVHASFSGDSNYSASTATPLTQTVGLGATSVTLASSANPASNGQSVTFTATVASTSPATGTPTGSVTFAVTGSTGAVACNAGNTVTLSGGAATCTITVLATQSTYSVHASYNGDTNYATSSASPLTQSVTVGGTTTTLSSSANPTVSGQSVTFTATVAVVAPATGTPGGTVTFSVTGAGGAVACNAGNTVTLSGGTATCTITGLASGSTYSVQATYAGNASYGGSSATPLTQTVNKGATTVSIGSNAAAPPVSGQSVTFTATVTATNPASGTPTGTVTFAVAGSTGAPVACEGGNTPTLSGGSATCTVTVLASLSPYSVHATYNSDANYSGSTAAPFSQPVSLGSTTTALHSSANPSTSGESVVFAADVSAFSPASGTPTGTVTFTITGTGGSATCQGGDTIALSAGSALCTVTTMVSSESTYSVHATYNGDSDFSSSAATPLTQSVTIGSTTTTLLSSANPAVTGEAITFTATVGGNGTPTGSVTFTAGGVPLACNGSGSGVVTLSGTTANCTVAGMNPTSFTVVASYGGNTDYSGSSSAGLAETVDQDGVTLTFTSDANPNVYGELFDLTVTVSASSPGVGTPTGTVTFFLNGSEDCDDGTDTYTLSGGQATCPIQFYTDPGSYQITADYSGDSNFTAGNNSSSPYIQTTVQDGTSTSVTTTNASVHAGTNVIYTAIATGDAPGVNSPPAGDFITFTATNQATGAVTDLDCGGTGSDEVAIAFVSGPNENEALCYAALGTAGTYTVTATYDGDTDFSTSAGTVTETVLPPG
jgi:large repetitive protein